MYHNDVYELPEKGSGGSAKGILGNVVKLAALKKEARSHLKGARALDCGDKDIEKSFWIVEKSRLAGERRFAFEDLFWPLDKQL